MEHQWESRSTTTWQQRLAGVWASEERSNEETKVRPIHIHFFFFSLKCQVLGPFSFVFGSGLNVAVGRHFGFSDEVGLDLPLSSEWRHISFRAVKRILPGPGHCGHFQKETKIMFHPQVLATVGQGSHLPSQTKTFLANSGSFSELITWI